MIDAAASVFLALDIILLVALVISWSTAIGYSNKAKRYMWDADKAQREKRELEYDERRSRMDLARANERLMAIQAERAQIVKLIDCVPREDVRKLAEEMAKDILKKTNIQIV